jgi:uncharacterized 2Fe-2S/4Fe-4S cluster protein (DUF4445 family)
MSDRVRIQLEPLGQTIEVEPSVCIEDVLFDYGVEFPCGGQGSCGGCRVRVLSGQVPISAEDAAKLTEEQLTDGWRLACHIVADNDLTLEVAQWEEVILADSSSFAFKPKEELGIAVDLGTTTIVAQLVDLRTAHVLAVESSLNPQAVHGGDIMSRVLHAIEPRGLAELRDLIRDKIRELIECLIRTAKTASHDVGRTLIVGNTVMHHLFSGMDVKSLSQYPFEPADVDSQVFTAEELGWNVGGQVHFLPCIGSFVGSDVLVGILTTPLHRSHDLFALADLGTNGEIVVGNRERMLCASTAAGPAFEGARISMGMRAATGAVSHVHVQDGGLICHVLGGNAPRGICGSGLVDAVAAGLMLGQILPDGRLADGQDAMELQSPVQVTQQDIRELQLAKGAIATGLRLLLKQWGAGIDDLQQLYLAGAFGNYVNRASAKRIGLFDCPVEKVHAAGNAALHGAKLALFINDDGIDLPAVRQTITHVPLAADPEFQNAFAEAMTFPSS